MPSREQMERAIREIEVLSEEYSFRQVDDGQVTLASHGRGTDDGFSFWGELTDAQKRDALARGVDWAGFSEGEKADVIGRVLDGEEADSWMDGIVADAASPQRSSSDEATHMDYQPTGRNRHIDRVTSRIEELKSAQYWCTEASIPSPHTDDEERDGYWRGVTSDGSGWDHWNNLTVGEKEGVLRRHVDWEGFARSHIKDVIDKVIREEPVERWMDGVRYPARPPASLQGEPSRPVADTPMNVASDVYTALMTHLESAADEFARLASTPEQAAFAKGFADFVADDAHASLKYLTGLAVEGDSRATAAAEAAPSHPGLSPSRDEIEAVVAAAMDGGFNWPAEPGQQTRPGPEETPLERVERQIGHIKLRPDPYDFSIEELGPWDSGVSDEWKRLPEAEKLSRLDRQVGWRDISPEDKQRLLGREVDLGRVPADPPSRGEYQVYDDAARDDAQAELVRDFRARIGGLIREGVPDFPPLGNTLPWEQATEDRKLANIVWESMSLHPLSGRPGMIALPGAVALEAVERHVDYAGLPEVQRELLTELRSRLDAGQFAGLPPGRKDPVADGLGRAGGIVDLEEMLASWKEDGEQPWAARPEAEKVRVIVDHALETAAPGAYTLAVVEREVDYAGLPPWRRAALEGLRARIDGGEFDGAGRGLLDPDDRLDRALRLAELEARVEDYKHLGDDDPDPGRYRRWDNMLEDVKLHFILGEIRELHLSAEPKAYEVVPGEVDLARVPEEMRREFEETRREARTAPDVGPQREPTPLERVERELRDWKTYVPAAWEGGVPEADKLRMLVREMDWTGVSPEDRAAVLAREVDFARVPGEARDEIPGDAPRQGRDTGVAAATPGRGEYQVWHIADDHQALLTSLGVMLPVFPEAYTRVATVEADSLDRAFALTNHGDTAWQENPGVVGKDARSTSVGDVIVDPQGRPYRVEKTGFEELPAPDESPLERVERQLRGMKQAPEIYLESTRHYVQPDPEDLDSVYDTCDVLGPWHTLKEAEKLRVLEAEFDWTGVSPEAKAAVLAREVALDRVPEEDWRQILGGAAREGPDTGERPAADPVVRDDRGAGDPLAWVRHVNTIGERERRAIAAYDAEVAEMARGGPGDEPGLARAWRAASEPGRLGLLADLAMDHGVEVEVFVRAARRVMGWIEPTAAQREAMADAWAHAEGLGVLSPEAQRTLHAEWRRDFALRSMPDRLPSPGEIAAGHDGTAAGRGEGQGRPFRDYARALLDRFRAAAGRIFGREILPPPSPGEIAEHGGPAAGPPGDGEYQVWHDRGWPQSRLDQMLGGVPPARFPEDYFRAADVQAGGLEEAVRLTTSTGRALHGDHRPWDGNRGVRSHTPKPFVPRDTDAGDVIVDPEGRAYRYDGRGFLAIEAAAEEPSPEPSPSLTAAMPPENQSAGFVGHAAETPPERIGREIRELKAVPQFFLDGLPLGRWADLSEAQKLEWLDRLDWEGIPPLERLSVIEVEVDLTRVSPALQRLYLGELRDQAMQAIHGGHMPSLTAAILADPQSFLPESGPSHDHDHNHGPERSR